jgi:hypothetical protein
MLGQAGSETASGVRRAFFVQGIAGVVVEGARAAHERLTEAAAADVQVAELPLAFGADFLCFPRTTLICALHGVLLAHRSDADPQAPPRRFPALRLTEAHASGKQR